MTIEEEITKIFENNLSNNLLIPIENWSWVGEPNCLYIPCINRSMIIVDLLIGHADDVECLTSSSKYIRECKKWFMECNTKMTNSYIQKLLLRFGSHVNLHQILSEAISYTVSYNMRKALANKKLGED